MPAQLDDLYGSPKGEPSAHSRRVEMSCRLSFDFFDESRSNDTVSRANYRQAVITSHDSEVLYLFTKLRGLLRMCQPRAADARGRNHFSARYDNKYLGVVGKMDGRREFDLTILDNRFVRRGFHSFCILLFAEASDELLCNGGGRAIRTPNAASRCEISPICNRKKAR